ncbi:MAG: dienelactone hydrolase family protein [Verrucomicrobiales bacterium]
MLLLHGLGADGHDFEEVAGTQPGGGAPENGVSSSPMRPRGKVTINLGMKMPAWYDILDLSQPRAVDWGTVEESARSIEALMAREPADRLILAGFSQGAAMALQLRHPDRIAGILMMSGYLLTGENHPCPPKTVDFPMGIFHGSLDPVVPQTAAEQAVEALQEHGYAPTLKTYPGLEHSVSDDELRDVFAWLTQVDSALG